MSSKYKNNIFNHNAASEHVLWDDVLWKNMFRIFLKVLQFCGRHKDEISWAYAHYFLVDIHTKILLFSYLKYLVLLRCKFWCLSSSYCLRNRIHENHEKTNDAFLTYFWVWVDLYTKYVFKNLIKTFSLLFLLDFWENTGLKWHMLSVFNIKMLFFTLLWEKNYIYGTKTILICYNFCNYLSPK